MASDVTAVWEESELWAGQEGLPPPFWAFCWPGGQALARWVLDSPSELAGRHVLDFGSGCGLVAIAAARSGACQVTAVDIDPLAAAAMELNAGVNGVFFEILEEDLIGRPASWDVVLAADVLYEKRLAEPLLDWLKSLVCQGVLVVISDPGRAYLPTLGLRRLATYTVPTSLDLEDARQRETSIYALEA